MSKPLSKIISGFFISLLSVFGLAAFKHPSGGGKTVYDFRVKTIDGEEISLSKFKGKKLLLVNVASECGFTPQYKPLQELSEKYKDKLVVIGFPANNFGAQEPGSNAEIKQF